MPEAVILLVAKLLILCYSTLVISLFFFESSAYFEILLIAMLCGALFVPFKRLRSGIVPISMFLALTFLGNALNHSGMIIYAAGPVMITKEGVVIALMKTARLFLMIFGAKLLMASVRPEHIVAALEDFFMPLRKAGIPVSDFFNVMELTLRCFPVLKNKIEAQYRQRISASGSMNMSEKAVFIATLMLPLFVESINSPDDFFRDVYLDEKAN